MARIIAEGTVKAGGNTYRLCVDSETMHRLSKSTGKKQKQLLRAMASGAGGVELLRHVCLALLARFHPNAGIEIAGDILTEDLGGLGAVIMAASRQGSGPFGNHAGHKRTLH